MGARKKLVAISAGGLSVWGVLTGLAPPDRPSSGGDNSQSVQERGRDATDRGVGDLGDAQDAERERQRSQIGDGVNSENDRARVPAEPRPGELPHIRLRF